MDGKISKKESEYEMRYTFDWLQFHNNEIIAYIIKTMELRIFIFFEMQFFSFHFNSAPIKSQSAV